VRIDFELRVDGIQALNKGFSGKANRKVSPPPDENAISTGKKRLSQVIQGLKKPKAQTDINGGLDE
jgi:hypothetical protein